MRYISLLPVLGLLLSALALPVSAHAEATRTIEVVVVLDEAGLYDAAMAAGSASAYAASADGASAIAAAMGELDATASAIAAMGGEVIGRSWLLSTSLGVRIAAGKLEALSALEGVASVECVLSRSACAVEADEASAVDPLYAPDLLGLDDRHADGMLGAGVLAAVIDTGFDLAHPVFTMPAGVDPAMTAEEVAAALPAMSMSVRFNRTPPIEQIWRGAKVAFAYDYIGDDTDVAATDMHGTHVASILGGGADAAGDYVGIAPGAQLALMKVFSDGATPIASDYAVYRAVEDALLLGADIISLSLGTAPGYSFATNTFSLFRHLERARETGTLVICAMGNDGAVGPGSVYDTERDIDFPLAANPDYGLTADPASYASTLAVGAYTPDRVIETGFGAGDGTIFAYTDSAAGQGFPEMTFADVLAGQVLGYVNVPGLGEAADYAGLSPAGKLALVERGTITFEEKLAAAHAAGAVGMICYNNAGGDDFAMAFTVDMPIPAISISREDGLRLRALSGEARTVTVSTDLMRLAEPTGAGKPADYSTVSSGLTMRPTVIAPGSIYAAIPGRGYRSISGTSMATPAVAGLCALALGAGRAADSAADLDALLADLITTASPIEDESGHPYPVRVQGGGAIDPEALFAQTSTLRAPDGRGLVELGDGLTSRFGFDVVLSNPTAEAKTYAVTASLASDDYFLLDEEGTVTPFAADRAHVFAEAEVLIDGNRANRYAEDAQIYTLTLAPGERRTLKLALQLSEEEAAEYSRYFVNGYYLEGYVYVETDEDCLSLPYLGFAGDFDALPYLDDFGYDGGRSYFAQNYLYAMAGEVPLNLGCNYYDENGSFRADLIAISPNGDGRLDAAQLNLNLLRNLYSLEVTITDRNGGDVQRAKRVYYLTKAFMTEAGELATTILHIWDGTDQDNADYVMPDGRYTATLRVFGTDETVVEEASLPIVLDTTPVKIVAQEIVEGADGTRRLYLTLHDDHYPMRAVLYRTEVDQYGRERDLYRDDHDISYREGRRDITLIYDITDFAGDYVYLDLYDYALNRETHKISVRP